MTLATGHRQRQRDANARTFADFTFQQNGAVDLLHGGAHDIHTHPAPGKIRDNFCGGKARREHQIDRIQIADALQRRLVDNAFFIGFALDYRRINPFAVIDDLNQNLITFLYRAYPQRAGRRLARRAPHVRGFQAVVETVADDMNQRVGQETR